METWPLEKPIRTCTWDTERRGTTRDLAGGWVQWVAWEMGSDSEKS